MWIVLHDTRSYWIYDYISNQCLSPLTLLVRIPFRRVCLRQVGGFLRVLRFPLTATIYLNIVECGVKHITLTLHDTSFSSSDRYVAIFINMYCRFVLHIIASIQKDFKHLRKHTYLSRDVHQSIRNINPGYSTLIKERRQQSPVVKKTKPLVPLISSHWKQRKDHHEFCQLKYRY